MPPADSPKRRPRDAAEDYRRKAEHEISALARRMKASGHPAPLGDPSSGVVLVVEQPVGPRVLEALRASLSAVGLPNAYVTYAATGLLRHELLATEPQILASIGPGADRELDDMNHPLARNPFREAREGTPFAWTRGTTGLRLPALAQALDDEARKRHFWGCFLALKDLTT